MILEGKNLTFSYEENERKILDHVDLRVENTERVAILGPSGFGKTTLCKILAGYLKPDGGEVLIDGKPLPQKGYCPVQMIWQHPELAVDPLLRLKETMKEVEEPDLAERMESFGIREEWLERFPSELSGGELQRFCLARALGKEVRYLLCDEISAMLDLWNQARIFELLLRETDRRKLGILIVSHDEALLERVCTRVESLEGGS